MVYHTDAGTLLKNLVLTIFGLLPVSQSCLIQHKFNGCILNWCARLTSHACIFVEESLGRCKFSQCMVREVRLAVSSWRLAE